MLGFKLCPLQISGLENLQNICLPLSIFHLNTVSLNEFRAGNDTIVLVIILFVLAGADKQKVSSRYGVTLVRMVAVGSSSCPLVYCDGRNYDDSGVGGRESILPLFTLLVMSPTSPDTDKLSSVKISQSSSLFILNLNVCLEK